MCRIKGCPSSENWSYINSMITTVHRGGNLLGKGLAGRTNSRKSKVNRTFRSSECFVLIFEAGHCKLDIIVNDFLRIPVVNKYFFDYLEFIFNLIIIYIYICVCVCVCVCEGDLGSSNSQGLLICH